MRKLYALLLVMMFFMASCVTPYDKVLEGARKDLLAGELKTTYATLDRLCKERPGEAACALRDDVKGKIGAAVFDKVKNTVEGSKVNGYLPLDIADALYKDIQELSNYGYTPSETQPHVVGIDAEKAKTETAVKDMLEQVASFQTEMKYVKAADSYNLAAKLSSSAKKKADEAIMAMAEELSIKSASAVEKEDWNEAAALLGELKYISPDYPGVAQRLDDAASKDSLTYFVSEAQEAVKKENFGRAIKLYQAALKYPDSDAIRPVLNKTKIAAASKLYKKGIEYNDASQPFKAYRSFVAAQGWFNDVPFKDRSLVQVPTKAINGFLEGLVKTAEKEEDRGNIGLAFQLMKMVTDIDANFAGAKKRFNSLQDKITQRAIKGFAVMPFKSTGYAPESGKIFSSNITFFLHKNLTPDIKVVEREAMETLLKEYEVKTAGQMDDKSRENILSLLGADYMLFGDVLDYKVESSQNETLKTVRAQTRTEKARNPEYDDWLKDKEKGAPNLSPQPATHIERPVFEDIKYKVVFYKKTGLANISYRVVDTKGKLLTTSIVELREEAADDGTDGVDVGEFKVPMKRAEVPSDIELMKRVQEKAIKRIGSELKDMFAGPEKKYLEEAVKFEKESELREAIERYSDVEIIYRKKGIDTKEVADKLGKLLDTITGI
ncbi:MAG: CsgG/HfaB family protein [Deltaproteobacteria bacterium]